MMVVKQLKIYFALIDHQNLLDLDKNMALYELKPTQREQFIAV